MKKVFWFFLLVITFLSVFGVYKPVALAQTEPSDDPRPNYCQAGNFCLGSATESFCKKLKSFGGNWTWGDGICQISKTEYKFSHYLGAWVDIYLMKVGLSIGLILIVSAGILYMNSGADPGKANLAKDLIFTTLGGLLFLYLAQIIFGWIIKF